MIKNIIVELIKDKYSSIKPHNLIRYTLSINVI